MILIKLWLLPPPQQLIRCHLPRLLSLRINPLIIQKLSDRMKNGYIIVFLRFEILHGLVRRDRLTSIIILILLGKFRIALIRLLLFRRWLLQLLLSCLHICLLRQLSLQSSRRKKLQELNRTSQIFISLYFDVLNLKFIKCNITIVTALSIDDVVKYLICLAICRRVYLQSGYESLW